MNPLYPCGKPCWTGTQYNTVKKLTLFFAFIKEIMMNHDFESRIPWECYQFFNQIENSITFAITIVIHKSASLIGTLWSSEFGPK